MFVTQRHAPQATPRQGGFYDGHGYTVAADLALPALIPATRRSGTADLTFRQGLTLPASSQSPGVELARLECPQNGLIYAIARNENGVVARFPGMAEFHGDHSLRTVSYRSALGADPGLVSVLATGTMLALRLILDGQLTLHASAVVVDGAAVAFVGRSGMGKSTMAALGCAAGASLLTDDVLRVSDPAGAPRAWPGARECRLRPKARSLAESAPGSGRPAARPTADGRTALAAERVTDVDVPLAACVVPMPSRDTTRVEVWRVRGASALMLLGAFPRVVGWREPTSLAQQFQLLGDLVAQVPVYVARVPWGPPFQPGVAGEVLDRVLVESATTAAA